MRRPSDGGAHAYRPGRTVHADRPVTGYPADDYREEGGRLVTGPPLPPKKPDAPKHNGFTFVWIGLVLVFFAALVVVLSTNPGEKPEEVVPKASPTLESPAPISPEKTPFSQSELDDIAKGVALLIGSDDWSAAASILQKADEESGCDIQAFTSFRVPGDFADPKIRRLAVSSAAEHDWQVVFEHSKGRWIALVQNCTEVPFHA